MEGDEGFDVIDVRVVFDVVEDGFEGVDVFDGKEVEGGRFGGGSIGVPVFGGVMVL